MAGIREGGWSRVAPARQYRFRPNRYNAALAPTSKLIPCA